MSYIYELLPDLSKKESSYQAALVNKYTNFIKYSELPSAFIETIIDTNKLPKHMNTLYTNIFEIIKDKFNISFNMCDYANTGAISSMLINEYFKQCILNDDLVDSVLYIDTNLLLDDYKKLIDTNTNELNPILTHSLETVYKNVETASFVIWDKFTLMNSNYDKQKLYNILSIRYRKGLGNLFFIKGGPSELGRLVDKETYNVMNISNIIDCEHEQIQFIENNKKGKLTW